MTPRLPSSAQGFVFEFAMVARVELRQYAYSPTGRRLAATARPGPAKDFPGSLGR